MIRTEQTLVEELREYTQLWLDDVHPCILIVNGRIHVDFITPQKDENGNLTFRATIQTRYPIAICKLELIDAYNQRCIDRRFQEAEITDPKTMYLFTWTVRV